MSTKTDAKKQLIIDKATEVFAERGYRTVTMKDIVEACEISRGGLYLYYSSVEGIFLDVIAEEGESDLDGIDFANAGCVDMLLYFLKEQKKEILKKKNNLAIARFEHAFAGKLNGDSKAAKSRLEQEMMVLEKILARGNEQGEFVVDDTKGTASNMVYAIYGMKLCAATVGITEKKVDSELVYLMRQFVEVEE